MKKLFIVILLIIVLFVSKNVFNKISFKGVMPSFGFNNSKTELENIKDMKIEGYPIWHSISDKSGYNAVFSLSKTGQVGLDVISDFGADRHAGYLSILPVSKGVVAEYSGSIMNRTGQYIPTRAKIVTKQCKEDTVTSPYTVVIQFEERSLTGCIREAK